MLKQGIIYLILSILVVLFAKYALLFIVYIDMIYTYFEINLTPIFSGNSYGTLIRNVLSLTLLPVIIAGIPALIYRAVKGKGKQMPYFLELAWVLWLIIVLSKVLVK